MQTTIAEPQYASRFQSRFLNLVLLALVILLGVFFAFRASRPVQVSVDTLAEKYGLRVSLVAVTAAGGFVDLRLKILDAEKAALLLQDKTKFPVLYIADSNTILKLPSDARPEIELKADGNLYVMYPNSRNAVKPGTAVTIKFGDFNLEPISAE